MEGDGVHSMVKQSFKYNASFIQNVLLYLLNYQYSVSLLDLNSKKLHVSQGVDCQFNKQNDCYKKIINCYKRNI